MGWLNYMQKNTFGVYEYKRRIPKDLLGSYPQCRSGVIKFSLKTKDKNEASIRNKQYDARYELEFANIRRKNIVPVDIRKDFIRKLRLLNIDAGEDIDLLQLTEMLDEIRTGQKNNEPTPSERVMLQSPVLHVLSDNPEKTTSKNRDLEYSRIIETIEQMIQAFNGEAADFHSIRQRYGIMKTARLLNKTIELAGGKALAGTKVTGEVKNAPPLSGMIELWLKERKKPAPKQTVQEWTTAVRRFEQLHGILPVSLITRQHVRDFRDALRDCSAHSKPTDNFGTLVAQCRSSNDSYTRLSEGTVNKNLAAVKSLLKTALEYDFIESNPATNITVDENPNNEDKRLPFDQKDLKTIFNSSLYLGGAPDKKRLNNGATIIQDSFYWLPLLALYTGARQSELAQLRVKDIHTSEDGFNFIDINSNDGKSLKSKSSRRIVPIHRNLEMCRFMTYVDKCKKNTGQWLFPEMLDDDGSISAKKFSKWFARFLDTLNIKDKKKNFHSFRHTFKQYARDVMTEEMHDALTGHTNNNVGRDYGKFTLNTLNAGIQKCAPPLDVRPIYRAWIQRFSSREVSSVLGDQ